MDIKKNETDFNVFDFISQNNSLKMNFEDTPRDLVKEKKIWEDFIQPIIRGYELYSYGDTLFEYEETKEPSFFSSDDLENMQRSVLFFTMELDWDAVYSPEEEKKQYFFIDDVLKVLSRDVSKYAKGSLDPNIINLRDKLWEYLTVIFDSNDLPVFLEILSREPGVSKVIEPNQQHRSEYQNKEAVYQGSPTVSDSSTHSDQGQEVNIGSDLKSGADNDIAITHSVLEWQDVSISFINDFEVCIQPKGETAVIRQFNSLGFDDGRSPGKPIRAWPVFITALSKKQEAIPYSFETKETVERVALELRKKFRVLFPKIDGDPIPHNKENRAYHMAFNIK